MPKALYSLLQSHFAGEEAPQGVFELIARAPGGRPEVAARMSEEHGEILAAVRDLIARVGADESQPVAALEAERHR